MGNNDALTKEELLRQREAREHRKANRWRLVWPSLGDKPRLADLAGTARKFSATSVRSYHPPT
ncbi:MAG: hypothetical protein NTW21_15935 [Verrucomicrobia bacterium]|nr:hypothetical protein [Verrucomicrobiota bacterium]